MAEIDTRPLESVQAAVCFFDRGGDQSRLRPHTNEEEIAILTKKLAACKLQLEVRESQHKQAAMEIEALEKAVRDLSDHYERDRARIAQLEAENVAMASRQAAADGEREALRDELADARGELGEATASVAFVPREVDAMETRDILERQVEMVERMEAELLAKTVEIEYLRSELKQVKEVYVSPVEGSDAKTGVTAADGCNSLDEHAQVQACETTVKKCFHSQSFFVL